MEATNTIQPTYKGQLSDTLFLGGMALMFLTSNLIVQNWLLFSRSPAVNAAPLQAFEAPAPVRDSLLSLLSFRLANDAVVAPAPSLHQNAHHRAVHARELLGDYYSLSPLAKADAHTDLSQYVRDVVTKGLPKRWSRQAPKVTRAILDSAKEHGLDPLFLVALIQTESSFRPDTRGPFGEIGLMQLRESTGKDVAARINLPWNGRATLQDPVKNIRLGSHYIAQLRDRFDEKPLLYIAAYNMGAANVRSAVARNVWPKEYSSRIMRNYFGLYAKLKLPSAAGKKLASVASN